MSCSCTPDQSSFRVVLCPGAQCLEPSAGVPVLLGNLCFLWTAAPDMKVFDNPPKLVFDLELSHGLISFGLPWL